MGHSLFRSNIYEVNLRQYTPEGSFKAFAMHLPRLKEMGVEILWFMPLTTIAQKNRKGTLGSYYACQDYTAINPEFGNAEDCLNLFKQAQDMGFKLMIDWVANHTGWDHRWTVEHPDFFKKDESTGDFKTASGMDDIIELDYDNPAMRRAMIDAMQFWINEYNIDGFRCDLAFWVRLDFWLEARKELDKMKSLYWFGEFDPLDNPDYLNAFDAAYTWTWMHKTSAFCKGKIDFNVLRETLIRYKQLCRDGRVAVWFTSNHDENSWNGTEFEKYGVLADVLNVFSFTWPGMPMIYGGQELPNQKRLAFFEKDNMDWSGEIKKHDFYRTLFTLRNNNPAFSDTNLAGFEWIDTQNEDAVLAYRRMRTDSEVWVLLNFSDRDISLQFNTSKSLGNYVELFSQAEMIFSEETVITLPPYGYQVLVKR